MTSTSQVSMLARVAHTMPDVHLRALIKSQGLEESVRVHPSAHNIRARLGWNK